MKLQKSLTYFLNLPRRVIAHYELTNTDRLEPQLFEWGGETKLIINIVRHKAVFSKPRKSFYVYLPTRAIRLLKWQKGDELAEVVSDFCGCNGWEIRNLEERFTQAEFKKSPFQTDIVDKPEPLTRSTGVLRPEDCISDVCRTSPEFFKTPVEPQKAVISAAAAIKRKLAGVW